MEMAPCQPWPCSMSEEITTRSPMVERVITVLSVMAGVGVVLLVLGFWKASDDGDEYDRCLNATVETTYVPPEVSLAYMTSHQAEMRSLYEDYLGASFVRELARKDACPRITGGNQMRWTGGVLSVIGLAGLVIALAPGQRDATPMASDPPSAAV